MENYSTSEIFRLLSDPSRVKLIKFMVDNEDLCVSELAKKTGITLSATSHQLRKLEFLGVVEKCRYGKEICYCINNRSELAKKLVKLISIKM